MKETAVTAASGANVLKTHLLVQSILTRFKLKELSIISQANFPHQELTVYVAAQIFIKELLDLLFFIDCVEFLSWNSVIDSSASFV